MTSIITRLFESPERAQRAVAEMEQAFEGLEIGSIPPPDATEGADSDRSARLSALGVPQAAAAAYGEAVQRGATAVVVMAPFGLAAPAIAVMDRNGATALDVADGYIPAVRPGATTSERWGVPLLLRDPAPLSTFLGLGLLSRGRGRARLIATAAPLSRMLGLATLSSKPPRAQLMRNRPGPFSRSIGLPLLTGRQGSSTRLLDNPAPLSSWLGWPVLADSSVDGASKDVAAAPRRAAPAASRTTSASLGLTELGGSAAPLSSTLGLPLAAARPLRVKLSKSPAPFSAMLGLPVLSKSRPGRARRTYNPAPFSDSFGWLTISRTPPSVTLMTGNPAPLSRLLGLPVLARRR